MEQTAAAVSVTPLVSVTSFFLAFFLVAFAIFLIPFILYLVSMQKALSRVAPERREMSPGLVWLMLIPLFGIVWHFFIVGKICASFKKEFAARGVTGEDNYGYPIGLTMCILVCCSIIPVLGILTGLAGFVLWIIWWVKVAGYSAKLAAPAPTAPR